jgi:LysR family transcriptional regulator, glycine cleavage system transcriptional activator
MSVPRNATTPVPDNSGSGVRWTCSKLRRPIFTPCSATRVFPGFNRPSAPRYAHNGPAAGSGDPDLTSTTAFLSHWMVPRLAELCRLFPDVDVRLHASDAIVELRSGGVDAAIRYGKGPFAGVASIPLRDDVFGPVCSPGLGLSKLDDLRQAALIHIDGRQVPAPSPDWPRWCAEAGLRDMDTQGGVRFPDSTLAVQAAIAGHGVAIVSLVLVANALDASLLVALFAPVLRGETYHFACAPDLEARPDIVALRASFLSVMSVPRRPLSAA